MDIRSGTAERRTADSWDGRRVFNCATGEYLGRAVGEPYSPDGLAGVVALQQDEPGQVPRSYAVCDYVVLDNPTGARDRSLDRARGPRAA